MFEVLPELTADPILGLMTDFKNDTDTRKVDLGAGVYKNENGHTPIMDAVAKAQAIWLAGEDSKVYSAPAGLPSFNDAIIELALGRQHPAITERRVVNVQTPGGCGALRVAANMLKRCGQNSKVWVSNPTWANHIPLLTSAGLELVEYSYYNSQQHRLDFDAMMSDLSRVNAGDIVLLHACCHNPSGADLSPEQWRVLAELLNTKGAIPYIDMAYLGLGDGISEDACGLRYLAEHCPELIVAISCSKNFGLYRERVGSIMVVAANPQAAQICKSQLLNIAREIYSMPPSYGAALVDIILNDVALKHNWNEELVYMRERINSLRKQLCERLVFAGAGDRFDYIANEKGMFSFLGLSVEQVKRLKQEHHIYMVDSSRINIAGLSASNMDYTVESIVSVL